ncbi:MAG: hypothetical protein ABSB49_03725 [Polyangia bacterium]
MRIGFWQKLWSYLEPVSLDRATSPGGRRLELFLARNQFLLHTEGALYSDGTRYLPAVVLAEHLADRLPDIGTVLVLGAGAGSLVRVLRARGCRPSYTLVDNDQAVLRWAIETLVDGGRQPGDGLVPVWRDAEAFMAENRLQFDLVFVDIFQGRRVPSFVTTPLFLRRCRASVAAGGHFALNYLVDDEQRWAKLHTLLLTIFPRAQVETARDNRIVISD